MGDFHQYFVRGKVTFVGRGLNDFARFRAPVDGKVENPCLTDVQG